MAPTPHLAPRIEVPGTFNFRDVGGHATQDGGRVATGRLFRADGLGRLGAGGVRAMRELRIASVLDLRETRETVNIPDDLDGLGAEYVHLPILGDRYYPMDPEREDRIVLSSPSLPALYAVMIDTAGPLFVEAITLLSQERDGAAVFHCSAGKDRTGFIAAFLLTLLGVDRDSVLSDYALTEQYLGEEFRQALAAHLASAGVSVTSMATEAKAEWLADVLDRLDREYGGVEGYLTEHGLRAQVLDRLRTTLVSR